MNYVYSERAAAAAAAAESELLSALFSFNQSILASGPGLSSGSV